MELGRAAKLVERYTYATAVLEKGATRALVVERGARLLAVDIRGANPLWVNPSLEPVLEAGGWNVGGLRLWISPERAFFYERPEEFSGWFCPHTIDPGEFKLVRVDRDSATLEGVVEARDKLAERLLRARVRREFKLVGEGKLLVRDAVVADYAGEFNLWALAQVEPMNRGTVIVPTKGGAQPVHYFSPISPYRLVVKDDHVAFKIDGMKVCKLGVRPEDLPVEGHAAIAHVTEVANRWIALIMRTCDAPRGQEECLDVARANPEGPKGCVQSYNSGPESGPERFGEVELHFKPAAEVGGHKISAVEYELEFTEGSRDRVVEWLRGKLGIGEPHIF